jgi:hypothetical protein
MALDPTAAPRAHRAIRGTDGRSNLLIALLRMGMSPQNDPGTHGLGLWRAVRTDELLKLLDFFSGQGNGISGFGTTHWLSPPLPVYLLLGMLSNPERTCESL